MYKRIVMPLIRQKMPNLIASQIASAQPMAGAAGTTFSMGLGPPVCTLCMIEGTFDDNAITHPWRCHNCGDFKLPGSLWSYTADMQEYIENRTTLYRNRKIVESKNELPHRVIRPFMFPDNPFEPNDRYRAWLEQNIGCQGGEWNWEIKSIVANTLEISFKNNEDAVLFTLSYQ